MSINDHQFPAHDRQKLVACIRKSSKYHYQAPAGAWFPASIKGVSGHCVHGNGNQYTLADVQLGVMIDDGRICKLSSR